MYVCVSVSVCVCVSVYVYMFVFAYEHMFGCFVGRLCVRVGQGGLCWCVCVSMSL